MAEFDEPKMIPPKGTYTMKIDGFNDPRPSSKGPTVFISMRVTHKELGTFLCFIPSHIATYEMLRQALNFFVGKSLEVEIKHVEHDDRVLIDLRARWNTLSV